PRPGDLPVLHAPQGIEHCFVGIRGHLDSFSKYSDPAGGLAGPGLLRPTPPRNDRRTLPMIHLRLPYPFLATFRGTWNRSNPSGQKVTLPHSN
ncbi:hypothetical protein PPH41_08550, partial [Burkholderia gladioli]|nr:hypothetical protein [Burkholderia gladioli]